MEAYRRSAAKTPIGKMVPHPDDWDTDLLSNEELSRLLEQSRKYGYKGDDLNGAVGTLLGRLKDYQKRKPGSESLSDNQYAVIDLASRASLEKKAELMFKAYQKHVLPKIEEVHNVQKPSGSGILDATVSWHGLGKRIVDNKTAGKPYSDNEADYSFELAMYAAEEKIYDVTYVVLIKAIQKNRIKTCSACGHIGKGSHKTCDNLVGDKRCGGEWTMTIAPEAQVQIVHGHITPEAVKVAVETEQDINRAVKAEIFPCNFPNCNKQFGKPCEYKDLRWKGDMTGLEKVEKKR
jgi:hypothetical protein